MLEYITSAFDNPPKHEPLDHGNYCWVLDAVGGEFAGNHWQESHSIVQMISSYLQALSVENYVLMPETNVDYCYRVRSSRFRFLKTKKTKIYIGVDSSDRDYSVAFYCDDYRNQYMANYFSGSDGNMITSKVKSVEILSRVPYGCLLSLRRNKDLHLQKRVAKWISNCMYELESNTIIGL